MTTVTFVTQLHFEMDRRREVYNSTTGRYEVVDRDDRDLYRKQEIVLAWESRNGRRGGMCGSLLVLVGLCLNLGIIIASSRGMTGYQPTQQDEEARCNDNVVHSVDSVAFSKEPRAYG